MLSRQVKLRIQRNKRRRQRYGRQNKARIIADIREAVYALWRRNHPNQ